MRSVCIHAGFKGTKDCPRCYPKYDSVVEDGFKAFLDDDRIRSKYGHEKFFENFLRRNNLLFDGVTRKKLYRFSVDCFRRGYNRAYMNKRRG